MGCNATKTDNNKQTQSGYVNLINIKVKGKALPLNAMKTYIGSEGKVPLILNLGTR
jgi:hypothetical protein